MLTILPSHLDLRYCGDCFFCILSSKMWICLKWWLYRIQMIRKRPSTVKRQNHSKTECNGRFKTCTFYEHIDESWKKQLYNWWAVPDQAYYLHITYCSSEGKGAQGIDSKRTLPLLMPIYGQVIHVYHVLACVLTYKQFSLHLINSYSWVSNIAYRVKDSLVSLYLQCFCEFWTGLLCRPCFQVLQLCL